MKELEIKKLRQSNNFLKQRENDYPGLNKGDVNKVSNYETIESVAFGKS